MQGRNISTLSICKDEKRKTKKKIYKKNKHLNFTEKATRHYSQDVELHLPADESVLLVDKREPLLHEALLVLTSRVWGEGKQVSKMTS